MSIAPGTPCYIIRTEAGNDATLGRVVAVVAPLQPMPQRGGQLMHEIDAPWLRIKRPRTHMHAAPSALKPITGLEPEPAASCEREPEQAPV